MAIFTNQATLSYNNTTTTSNIVTGEIIEVLSAAKNAVDDEYRFGDTVTYVVSIVNTGIAAFNNLTITDDLGAYTASGVTRTPLTYVDDSLAYYANGVLQTGATAVAGPPLVISGINVPAGGNAIIIYNARVNEFAPAGADGVITNTATVTGGGLSTDITAQATVSAAQGPQLSISKALTPTTVVDNGEITYTFVILNTGNEAALATDNLSITDTFEPILDITAVNFNGTAWTEGTNYTYDETTGLFTTLPGQITVPAATYTQDPTTGAYIINPGTVTLTVTGTV